MGGIGSGGQNRLRPYEALYRLLVRVATRKHREVMSFDDFLGFTRIKTCRYCGHPVKWVLFKPWGAAYNLDRRQNLLGYTKSNCVVCCGDCNVMKGRKTSREFFEKIRLIYRRRYER